MGKGSNKSKKKFYLFESEGFLIYAPSKDVQTVDPDTVSVGDSDVPFLYGSKMMKGQVLCIARTEDEMKREMAAVKASRSKNKKSSSFHADKPRAAKKKALESDFASISSGKQATTSKTSSGAAGQDEKKRAKQAKVAEKKRLDVLRDKAAEVTQAALLKNRTEVKKEHCSSDDESDDSSSSTGASSENEPLAKKSSKVKSQDVKDLQNITSGSGSDSPEPKRGDSINENDLSNSSRTNKSDIVCKELSIASVNDATSSSLKSDVEYKKTSDNAAANVSNKTDVDCKKSDSSAVCIIGSAAKTDLKSSVEQPTPPQELIGVTKKSESLNGVLDNGVSSGAGSNGEKESKKSDGPDSDQKKPDSKEDIDEIDKSSDEDKNKKKKKKKNKKRSRKSKKSKSSRHRKRRYESSSTSSSSENSSDSEDREIESTYCAKGLKGETVNFMRLDSTDSSGSDKKRQREKKKRSRKRNRHHSTSSSSTSSDRPRRPKVKRNKSIYSGVNYLHTKDSVGVVKLHENFEVYVAEKSLNEAKTISHFIRMMVDKIYTTEALENSTAQGFPPRSFGEKKLKKMTILPAIHPDGRLALIAAARDLESVNKWRHKKDNNTVSNVFSQRLNDFKK